MSTSTHLIKKVSSIIEESLSVPMWGKIPSFPWESFCETLKTTFNIDRFSITHLQSDWKEHEELLQGLGEDPAIMSFTTAPLSPPLFWATSNENIEILTKYLLDKEGKKSFSDKDFQKGFLRFNFLQVLKAFDHLKVYEGLSPKMCSSPLPEERSYCIDVNIQLYEENFLARLICPLNFHHVFTSHFSSKPFSLDYVDSSLELSLNVQVGHVTIHASEWNEVGIGDFVILDQCSYHPNTKQGSFFITLDTTPLFIAKHKYPELKILDYALYEQEDSFMMEDTPNDEEIFDEDEMTEDFEEAEEDEEEPSHETLDSPVQEILSFKNVPLSLSVEVAHIKMSLQELLSLKPGNTLQLPVSIEQGVMITLNSKVIARGELLQLGDLLGVKISEISH